MLRCEQCLLDLTIHKPIESGVCPNCGAKVTIASSVISSPQIKDENFYEISKVQMGPPVIDSDNLQQNSNLDNDNQSEKKFFEFGFFKAIKNISFNSRMFFNRNASSLISNSGLSSALAFAVLVNWISSSINFLFGSFFSVNLEKFTSNFTSTFSDSESFDSLQSLHSEINQFLFGAGKIVLSPFFTLAQIFLSALFIHLAVKLFFNKIKDRTHSYQTTVKIISYSMAPMVLSILPGIGTLIGWILSFSAAVVGLSEVYQNSRMRSGIAVMFPQILLIVLLMFSFISIFSLIAILGYFLMH